MFQKLQLLWFQALSIFDNSTQKETAAFFNFETIETKYLGKIRRPTVKVQFWSEAYQEWQTFTMLVDSGADITVLPMYMAGLLDLDMSQGNTFRTNGIEGTRKTTLVNDVRVKIGSLERVIPVGIAHSSRIPPLMGRHFFLETFETTFEGNRRIIFKDL